MAKDADDPRFHHEIWTGRPEAQSERTPSIYYVENHNGQCGYGELAGDFKMAADLAIAQLRYDGLANWTAPIGHLVRQTVELRLKALLETAATSNDMAAKKALSSHNLPAIWDQCRRVLEARGYKFKEDARMATAEWFIATLDGIDPSGDLFRFGISNRTAFGKQKSYDRVGIRLDEMVAEFEQTAAFLYHWEIVPLREQIAKEEGWDNDPYFDPDDFPRIGEE